VIESAGDVPVVELSEGITLQESAAHHHEGEGEEADHEEGEDTDEDGVEADHEEEHATDPHTWTMPANGVIYAQNAAKALSTLDPANAEIYAANAAAYIAQLNELDEWIQAQIDTIPAENRKLVTDHLAFGYYCSRYGLEQVGAVIPSFSTEAGTSAQELAALEDTMRAEAVKALFVDGAINSDVADALAADLGVQTVPLYTGSLGTEGSGVDTYLDYLRYNTTAIVGALQ
jgi:ABC-type Zn uptake system ZnuABC Zn-binding protein ZnuA